MEVGERRVDIVDLGWPLGLTREPIFAGKARVSDPPERDCVAAQLATVAVDEAAAMDQKNAGTVRERRSVKIRAKFAPSASTNDHRLDCHSV